jgi:hypothetical protein
MQVLHEPPVPRTLDADHYACSGERFDVPSELLAQGVVCVIGVAASRQGGGVNFRVRRQIIPNGSLVPGPR